MITRKQIEQYATLRREISLLENQIYSSENSGGYAVDTVRGSTKELPYAIHNIVIKGYTSQHIPVLIKRKEMLEKQCAAVESFVEGIDDSIVRQLFTWRYIEGRNIAETSRLVGYGERQARRIINGFFEKMSANVR